MSPAREARLARAVVFVVVALLVFGAGLALLRVPDARSSDYRWGPGPTLCADCRAGG